MTSPDQFDFSGNGTVTTITFPSSAGGGARTYKLQFDAGNRITKVKFPAGGYTRYDYNSSLTYSQVFSNVQCSVNVGQLFHKYECASSSGSCSAEQTTTYTPQLNGNNLDPFNNSMSIVDPLGNKQVHNFAALNLTGPGPPGSPEETDTYLYNGSGTLLRTIHTDYALSGLPSSVGFPSKVTMTLNDGNPAVSSVTQYNYESYVLQPSLTTGLIDNATEIDTYGFDGTLKRKVTQQWEPATAFTASPMIVDRLQWSTVTDATTNAFQTTTNGYDASGNVTSVSLSATGMSPLTTSYTRNSLGQVIQVRDPRLDTTGVGYGDNWSGGSSCGIAANSSAFPTSVTDALNQTTMTTYNACTGTVSSTTDPNGMVVSHTYDALARTLCTTVQAAGASSCISYQDGFPESVSHTVAQTSTQKMTSVASFDGFGRVNGSQLTSDPSGTVFVDTVFDALGRVYSTSTPYRSTSDATYGLTTHTYDGLGRLLNITAPDSTQRSWNYQGNVTRAYDERQSSTQSTVDSFGNLTGVTESTGASTAYVYDGFGNLTNVTQAGVSGEAARARSFQYDGFSRLLTATNPETGQVCYGLWSGSSVGSGTCQGGYDANGNLLAQTNANGTGSKYAYDALNRATGKTYFSPAGTNGFWVKSYFYDGHRADGGAAATGGNQIGRLSSARSWAPYGNGWYDEYQSYDAMGRVTRRTEIAQSESGTSGHTLSMGYDLAGNMTSLIYPDGRALTQTYDSAGRLSSIMGGDGTPYVSSVSYFPNGTPNVTISSNVIAQQNTINNRLQVCETAYGNQYGTLMDRQYFFGTNNSAGTQCNPVAGNNGNIFHVMDGLNVMNSQHYSYDALNRLTQFNGSSPAGAVRQQSFGYDSFGNLTQATGSTPLAASSVYGSNNRYLPNQFQCTGINGETGGYDAAGNLLCTGVQNSTAQAYGYNEESQIVTTSVQQNSNGYHQRALYSFDSSGQRIRADQFDPAAGNETGWREYTYLNGQVLAEKDNTGAWTDQVYVHGRKLAQINPTVPRVHVRAQHSQAGCASSFVQSGLGGYQYQIKAKDTLFFDQQTSGANGGLVLIPYNAPFQPFIAANTLGSVQHRSFDLSSIAGETVNGFWPMMGYTDAGASEMYLSNVTIVSADGTVTPIFNGQSVSYGGLSDTCGGSTGTMAVEQSALPETRYFAVDQVGTAQMELASGGWPVWKGEFTPFGQELDTLPTYFSNAATNGSSNRYRYTGKERDTESGLDYFGARYYGSNMGRFMSPDWSAKATPVPYAKLDDPQSLNLYSYVRNNPLSRVDLDGHDLWMKGCGNASATCNNDYVGTWDKGHKNFTPTTIQSDAKGNFTGHQVTMDGGGIHVDGKMQGVFASGTSATVVNGTGGLDGFRATFSGNCMGHCEATGTLSALPGHSMQGLISGMRGPNESLDRFSGHEGDQYRSGNVNGPDMHLSFLPGRDAQSMHFDWRFPFGSAGGFVQHTKDWAETELSHGPDPSYDKVGP